MDARETKTGDGRQKLVECGEVNNAVKVIYYKECSCSEAEKIGDKMMTDFRNFVEGKQADDSTMELIYEFERLRGKNKHHRADRYEKKVAMYLDYRPIGWASDMHTKCNSKYSHTFPLTISRKVWKNKKKIKTNHRRLIKYSENIMGVLAPFITGMVPTELNSMVCMLNLPKSNNFANTIYK